MAITATTLSGAAGAKDTTLSVTSATGIAGPVLNTGVANILFIDQEYIWVTAAPVGTAVPVQRGYNGTTAQAHANGANVQIGLLADFGPFTEYVTNSITVSETQGSLVKPATFLTGSADALSGAPGIFVVKTAGVDAITIPTPTASQEGNMIEIWSDTTNAHTVTAASACIFAGATAKTVITFPALRGSGCILRVCNLGYHLVSGGPGGNATAATGGTPIGALVLT